MGPSQSASRTTMDALNEVKFGTDWSEDRFEGAVAFSKMSAEFETAAAKYPDERREVFYTFAGETVRLRVVGKELATHLDRPFCHLRVSEHDVPTPRLTIRVWD